ncbi:MAG: aminotransferase class V-fold PLP-dependent enzyme [Thalassolituus sp.]
MDSTQFPVNETHYYLNHAAVAPWPRCASDAVAAFAQENTLSGAANYPQWLDTETALRSNLAQLINSDPAEIALVKNTSEALSFVAYGIEWQKGDVVVIPDEEFPSNSIVWESLQDKGVVVKKVSVKGDAPESELLLAIASKPRLVSVSAVQYATGVRLDLEQIGDACRKNGVLYCIDAIQAVGALEFDVRACQCDFAMADGHKWLLGPEGIGFFYVRRESMELLSLSEYGWHMIAHPGDYYRKEWEIAPDARRFECGSPNLLGATALKASTDLLLATGIEKVESLVCEKTTYLADALRSMGAGMITPGSSVGRSGIITFSTGTHDPVAVWRELMAKQVICMHRGGGIRFSPHFHTPQSVLDLACEAAAAICRW